MAILRKPGPGGADWSRCPACAEILPTAQVEAGHRVCPGCGYHHPLGLAARLALILDEGSFQPQDAELVTTDLLRFKGARRYKDQLAAARKASGAAESVHAGVGQLEGRAVAVAGVDGDFLEGSLGCVAVERLSRVFRQAAKERLPAVVVTSGGRLRHAEGVVGLSQVARLSEARQRLREAGGLFISVIAAPLPTGAANAYAFSGDVNLAEPGVVAPDELDDAAERRGADGLLEAGLVDRVVARADLKAELSRLIDLLT
jgi:acetyl-CoA carboxylase carboxyl transferase beta subunit